MKTTFTKAMLFAAFLASFMAANIIAATSAHAAEPSAFVTGTNKEIQLDDEFDRVIKFAHEVVTDVRDDKPLTEFQILAQAEYMKSIYAIENRKAREEWPQAPILDRVDWNIYTTVRTDNPFLFVAQ